jgi:DNA-binding response OmpR family regulator
MRMRKGGIILEAKILIVDDEANVRSSLRDYFLHEGFSVFEARNADEVIDSFEQIIPDLVILDVHLQGSSQDGLDICRYIRRQRGESIAIIMISGNRRDTVDKVVGLELGADVYITKPFETRFLLAQVKALLRKLQSQSDHDANAGWLVVDDHLRIHLRQMKVLAGGKEVHLTKLEFRLLEYLVKRAGEPCAREDLMDSVWKYPDIGEKNDSPVSVCVARLKKKIEPDQANPCYILSVHGVGYRFREL